MVTQATGIIITNPTGQLSRTTQTICRTGEMERENKSYSREEEEEEVFEMCNFS